MSLSKDTMQPFSLDVNLEYHEKLLNAVGSGIQATKKKIQESELLLNLEPPEYEPELVKEWKDSVDTMFKNRQKLTFPTLGQMKNEHEIKRLIRLETRNKQRAISREEWGRRATRIMQNQAKHAREKVQAVNKGPFGSSIKGEVIRVINDYQGCNTFEHGKKVLVKKEATDSQIPKGSNLPTWFGPQYYEIQYDPETKKDKYYQVAFKSINRNRMSAETKKRSNINRLKQEISDISLQNKTLHKEEYEKQIARMKQRSLKELKELFSFLETNSPEDHTDDGSFEDKSRLSKHKTNDEDFSINSQESRMFSPIAKDYHPLTIKVRDQHQYGPMLTDEEQAILHSNAHSIMHLNNEFSQSHSFSLDSFSSASNSLDIHHKSKKMQEKEASLLATKNHKYPPVVLNPLYASNAFVMKILSTEEKLKKRFKTKDYTMDALINQIDISEGLHRQSAWQDDSDEEDEKYIEALKLMNQEQNRSPLTKQPSSANIKYSSDIFKLKPTIPYKFGDQLIKEGGFYNSPTNSRPQTSNLNKEGSQYSESTNTSGRNTQILPVNFQVSRPNTSFGLGEPSLSDSTLPDGHVHFASSVSLDQSSTFQSRPSTKYSENNHSNQNSEIKIVFSNTKLTPLVMNRDEHMALQIDSWCLDNNVIRPKYRRKEYSEARKHLRRPLQSIGSPKLSIKDPGSLYGLLLKENPYTEKDELIKKNMDRDPKDILV